jgi:hypothetical protein
MFKEDREGVKDDERTGRPKNQRTDENVEKCENWFILADD